jgi:hypothetical protein
VVRAKVKTYFCVVSQGQNRWRSQTILDTKKAAFKAGVAGSIGID